MPLHVIAIHADAPAKPASGSACNGCGTCCLAEPCPLGMLVSGRRRGACRAVRWSDVAQRYQCGLVSAADDATAPRWSKWLRRRLIGRWIAAGRGCDSDATLAS